MIKKYDKYPNLVFIIISDLFYNARSLLFILCLVLFSGISVVIVTYKTRELIAFHERIVLEKDVLEIENRHLMLEETVLGDITRIEFFALGRYNMKYIDFNEKHLIYFYN